MFSILIVEDNISDREGIKGLIAWEKLGIEVVGAAVDGVDGYNQAIRLRPDFILTDIAMPVMDGIKMTQKLRLELPHIKFIFMSCFDDFEFLKNAIDFEVCGYILKPVDLAELTAVLEKTRNLRQSELERELNEEKLKMQIKESLPMLREKFFKDLLYGKPEDEKDIRDRMEYLGMDITHKYYAVLFLQLDNYNLLYQDISMGKRYLILYSVQKCIQETILKEIPGYAANQQYNNFPIILFPNIKNHEEALDKIIDAVNKCKESIGTELGLSITTGISEFSACFAMLPKVFETAEFAVESKFFSGGGRIIMASEVKAPDDHFHYDILEIKRRITRIVEDGDEGGSAAFIDEYYDSGVSYPPAYTKSLTFSIVNMLQTLLLERNESYGSIFGDDMLVWNKLLRFETIVDIKQWMLNIIEAVRVFFNKAENGRYQRIVEDIKSVVNERYAVIESVSQIVNPLFISVSHANLIFRQHTGQTIFDYLIRKRMEIAKQMLMDPYIKIYEIVEKTGYKANSHFTSVFKEYTGLTPKQFRDKHFCQKFS